jgi:hypothetical protein
LRGSHDLVTEKVQQKTVDDYLTAMEGKRTVIKIDTEGNELSVLRGAARVLERIKPQIIFECREEAERLPIYELFESFGYSITNLPWNPQQAVQRLDQKSFCASLATNFIAVSS